MHSTNVRHQAIRELEEFTVSLGGKYNTDLQDGGSWVYLDKLHLTETQALQFAAIARKRSFGMGSFRIAPIYLSLRNTRCDGPVSELVTEHVWYCFLDGQRLTRRDIQQIVDRAPNLSQLSLASTNVDNEMLGSLRHTRLNALDVRETKVTAEGLCSLYSATDSPPTIYSGICGQDRPILEACGISCSE